MKKHIPTILLFLVFATGLCLLLYPTVSDYWNSFHQSRAIASYAEHVAEIDDTEYRRLWDEAVAYNEKLYAKTGSRFALSDEEKEEYEKVLDVSGTGIMGYVEVPSINVSLPIYHGTSEAVLQVAIGHLEGSSLPVGGKNTHTVISGHRGLPSAKLFTDLDRVVVGDLFILRTLDEILTYEVDQIHIVLPTELQDLEIEDGKDYCTLITCTPYGVNSHRMLVRGHRVDNLEEVREIRVSADALLIDPMLVAPVVAIPVLLLLLIGIMIRYRRR